MAIRPSPRCLSSYLRRFLPLFLIACILLVASSCARIARRNEYVVETPPMPYKRAPEYEETDWVHRWRSNAFRYQKPDPASVAPRQRAMLREYGVPDYTRTFRTQPQNKEKVTEWVYLENDLLVQFVNGNLAYSGPVTDMEKLLIDRGYPDVMMRNLAKIGPERKQYIYWNWLHTRSEVYSFADGYLVEMQE